MQEICQITNLRKLEVDVNVTADKVYYVGLDVGLELKNHLRARMLANGSGLEKVGLEEFLDTKKGLGCLAWVAVSNYAFLAIFGRVDRRCDGIYQQRKERIVELTLWMEKDM